MATTSDSNAKWLLTILSIVALAVGAVLWATSSHADIKDWTAAQDFVTKKELTDVMKEQYVPFAQFLEMRAHLENLCKSSDKITERLDKIDQRIEGLTKKK